MCKLTKWALKLLKVNSKLLFIVDYIYNLRNVFGTVLNIKLWIALSASLKRKLYNQQEKALTRKRIVKLLNKEQCKFSFPRLIF